MEYRARMSRAGGLLAILLLLATFIGQSAWAGPESKPMREILIVGNGADGSVSFIDAKNFTNLGEVNVTPDLWWRLTLNPFTAGGYSFTYWREGGQRIIDDLVITLDGRLLIASRGWLGDVAAFDLSQAHTPMVWRHKLPGLRADHMDISPDGSRIVVSDTLNDRAFVLDPYTGDRIGEFPTGTYAHGNDYSRDGKRIYNASIGSILVPYFLNAYKGKRQLTIVDAETLQVIKTYQFDRGIRPAAFNEDETLMYAQFSYERGFRTVDLTTGEVIDRYELPASDYGLREYSHPDSYPNNSAHHGMALSGNGKKLCLAGTIDNYIAIVDLKKRSTDAIIHDVGKPYWAETSSDGRYCYVSNSDGNDVSVVEFATAQEVARIPVGAFPQRSRPVRVPEHILTTLFGY